MKLLNEVLKTVEVLDTKGSPPNGVAGIAYDSRKVREGTLFVCLRGQHVDGHDYIEKARQAGAACVLVEEIRSEVNLPQIRVAGTLKALAEVSSAFYDSPGDSMTLAGITGANGKTSSAFLLESILGKAGRIVGLTGTIECRWPGFQERAANTTPLSLDLQEILWKMRQAGVDSVVMEVSSHSLVLDRVHGLRFQTALFQSPDLTRITSPLPWRRSFSRRSRRYPVSRWRATLPTAIISEFLIKISTKGTTAILPSSCN